MKAVKVEYQVRPDYVEQNKANIKRVMEALKLKNVKSVLYSSYYLGDGKFVHHNIAPTDFSELNSLTEFKEFQEALKTSQPIVKPAATDLELVGISQDIF
jgi:hypothetical protein